MDQPGWSLEQVFKAASREILRQTNNRQRPWQLVSLQGDFVFKPAKGVPQPREKNALNKLFIPALRERPN